MVKVSVVLGGDNRHTIVVHGDGAVGIHFGHGIVVRCVGDGDPARHNERGMVCLVVWSPNFSILIAKHTLYVDVVECMVIATAEDLDGLSVGDLEETAGRLAPGSRAGMREHGIITCLECERRAAVSIRGRR